MSDSPFDLSGRVALIIGTSGGLGQCYARALARAGVDIAMMSRDKQSLSALADEIRTHGRQTFSVDLDVRDYNSNQNAVAAIEGHFGRIDILVNNAGCNIRKFALDLTLDDWNTVLETNLRGPFFVAQAVASGMIPRRYGRIIN
jgi:NADP-dependent 3-hydroxy acid dehydrogenase YdfG